MTWSQRSPEPWSSPGPRPERRTCARRSRSPHATRGSPALYRAANGEAEAGTREIFARAIARGEVRADVNLEAAVQLITGILLVRTVTGTPMPALDEVDSLVDLMLRGLG